MTSSTSRLRALITTVTVLAVGGAGSVGSATAAAAADPTAPTAPTSVSARAGVNTAKVYWAPPANSGESPVDSYVATSVPEGKTCTAPSTGTSCYVPGLTNGQSYTFTVTATNAIGTSPAATTNAVTPATDTTKPVLVSSEVSPRRVSSLTSSTVVVRLRITDDLSGRSAPSGALDANPAILFSQRGTSASFGFTRSVNRISGDEYDGIYQATVSVPAGTAPGEWDLTVYPIRDAAGNSTSFQDRPGVLVGAPSAPTAVSATAAANREVTVTWSPPSDNGGNVITGYQVTDSHTGTTRTVAGTSWTGPFADIDATVPVTFTVAAVNAAGVSDQSAASQPITVPAAVPSAVRDVTTVRGNASATITWAPPTATNGAPVTGYTVTTLPEGPTTTVPASATSAVVDGLSNGSTYTFSVTASNSAGSSPAATSGPVTPAGVPDAPSAVSAVGGDRSAVVSWSAPAGNGSPVVRYAVTASPGGRVTYTSGGATSATVSGLVNGTTYTFTVAATNDVGASPASEPSEPVTASGAPDAPSSVKAVRGNRSATIAWAAPNNQGSEITGYTVTYNGTTKTLPATARSVVLTELVNGTAYKVSVAATNARGTGAASAAVTVTPAGKAGQVAKPAVRVKGRTVTITWKPAAANGAPITSYTVTGAKPASRAVGGGVRKLVVRSLKPGRYKIRVTARNAVGAGAASPSVTVKVRR